MDSASNFPSRVPIQISNGDKGQDTNLVIGIKSDYRILCDNCPTLALPPSQKFLTSLVISMTGLPNQLNR